MFYSFTYNNIFQPLRFVGLDNYVRMFTRDAVFPTAVQNTLVLALITGPLGYILSFSLAWLINEVNSKLRMLFVLIFYSPAIAGSIYVVFGVLFSGDMYGYVNGFAASTWGFIERAHRVDDGSCGTFRLVITLCVLWGSMGAGFLSFVAGPEKRRSSSCTRPRRMDGLRNRWQELWYVTLPVMKPQLMFGVVMSISGAFSIHDVTIALAGYPIHRHTSRTTIVNLMSDVGYQRFELGYASAMATVLFVIMILARQLVGKLINRVGR